MQQTSWKDDSHGKTVDGASHGIESQQQGRAAAQHVQPSVHACLSLPPAITVGTPASQLCSHHLHHTSQLSRSAVTWTKHQERWVFKPLRARAASDALSIQRTMEIVDELQHMFVAKSGLLNTALTEAKQHRYSMSLSKDL